MNIDPENSEVSNVHKENPLESHINDATTAATPLPHENMVPARNHLANKSTQQLKTPWVPAPGKSSNKVGDTLPQDKLLSSVPVFSSSSSSHSFLKIRQQKPSSTSLHSKDDSKARLSSATSMKQKLKKDQHRHNFRQQGGKLKSVKHRDRRQVSSFKLQSKDSLVDVTSCLQAKREDVMKLREKSLSKDDPLLLSLIENTNRLAIQAAEEVESLRNIIQGFQLKEQGLSEEDCMQLDKKRAKVLEKVREFEAADNELQEIIARRSASKTSIISTSSKRGDAASNHSTSKIHDVHISDSAPILSIGKSRSSYSTKDDVIFLKEKDDIFSDESKSEHEENFASSRMKMKHGGHEGDRDISCVASEVASILSLGRLKVMYDENLTFPPLSESEAIKMDLNRHPSRTVRFVDGERNPEQGTSMNDDSTIVEDLYREKVSSLQRKLMDTEEEVVDLKSEIERIESEANFRVRMLQNSVQDKFDSLKVIPEYLHVVDHKLHESTRVKTKLENDLRERDACLREANEFNRTMRKETEELREKLRNIESSRDVLLFKNTELEKNNQQLRKEVEEITRQMATMQSQILGLQGQQINIGSSNPHSPRVASSSSSLEFHKLKFQYADLKDQVAQYKRIILSLKKSKTKLASGLNQRIEELIVALEKSQDHKRQLCDQIGFLKKSYNELFPMELFTAPIAQAHTKKSSKSKRKAVNEPKIIANDIWRTGYEGSEGKINADHPSQKYDSGHHLQELPSKVEFVLGDEEQLGVQGIN